MGTKHQNPAHFCDRRCVTHSISARIRGKMSSTCSIKLLKKQKQTKLMNPAGSIPPASIRLIRVVPKVPRVPTSIRLIPMVPEVPRVQH